MANQSGFVVPRMTSEFSRRPFHDGIATILVTAPKLCWFNGSEVAGCGYGKTLLCTATHWKNGLLTVLLELFLMTDFILMHIHI